jgi:hypothetical protein
MNIEWDRASYSFNFRAIGYVLWTLSSILFISGIVATFPPESPGFEVLIILCIVIAQIYSLINYHKKQSLRLLSIIVLLLFWSIGFLFRRLDLINDGFYGIWIGIFVISVIFVRTDKKKR